MFQGLTNIASIMKQASQIGGKVQEISAQLKHQRATGNAGGGMVEVEVNGLGDVLRVSIDPTLVEKNEREMIEDLVAAAVNGAIAKSKELHAEAMKSVTSGFNIPGLDDALSKLGEEEHK